MNPFARCIATKALLFLLSLCLLAAARAEEAVGTVVNLNGPLLARKADGTVKVLAVRSAVFNGDLLVTEANVYARIRFADDSEVTLRPSSQFKIESFRFEPARVEQDQAKFNLIKGGLRAVTGTIGKRSQERVGFTTPSATIGIRGTTFIAEYVGPSDASLAAYREASLALQGDGGVSGLVPLAQANPPAAGGQRPPGLYLQVIDGVIHVSNPAGANDMAAGQFGYAANLGTPPVVLPANPGMQFSPPPAFSTHAGQPQDGGMGAGPSDIDCEVR